MSPKTPKETTKSFNIYEDSEILCYFHEKMNEWGKIKYKKFLLIILCNVGSGSAYVQKDLIKFELSTKE